MTNFPRAHLIEITKYSKPWSEDWLSANDGVIQRAGSQGDGRTIEGCRDYRWNEFHANVMRFPVRGAYWYFGSIVPWRQQADMFLQIAGKDFHFLVCDFETFGNQMSASFVASAMEFCVYLKSKGYKVLIYTNLSIYQEWINRWDKERASQFELWISWPVDHIPNLLNLVDIYAPSTPAGRPDWKVWQYMFGEHNPTGCEWDVFNGTPAELLVWATNGQTDHPVIITPPGETMYKGTVVIEKLNIRAAMDPNSADVGDLLRGAIVTGDKTAISNGFEWLHIVTPAQFSGKFVATGPALLPRSFIQLTGTPEVPPTDPTTIFAEYKLTIYSDKSAKVELL